MNKHPPPPINVLATALVVEATNIIFTVLQHIYFQSYKDVTCLVEFWISQKTINSSFKSRTKMEVKFLKISKFSGSFL